MGRTELLEIFAKRLKGFRKNKNILQRELANEVDLSLRYFQKVESGQAELKLKTISSFAEALEIPPCYLLNKNACLPECPTELGCLVELLNMLSVGVQLTNLNGKVLYENQTHRDFLTNKLNSKLPKAYFWDYCSNDQELQKIKCHIEKMVQNESEQTTLFSKFQTEEGVEFPVKIDFKFISKPGGKFKYFLNTIHYHPSW